MKLKLGLQDLREETTIQVTADGTATAQDVAMAIASANQPERVDPGDTRLTLRVTSGYGQGRVLAPDAPVSQSGVQSGMDIQVTQEGSGVDPNAVQAAMLRVVGGPDAGIEVPLRFGTSRIGRTRHSDVRLNDPKVSKNHARVLVGDLIEVADDNSANGVLVGGERVSRATLGPGDTATIGGTTFRVDRLLTSQQSSLSDVPYLRPPLVRARPKAREIEMPPVPEEPRRIPFPFLAMIAPVLMGAVLYTFTRSPLTVIFLAMSPLLMIGNFATNRIEARRQKKRDRENFDAGMINVAHEIAEAQAKELAELHALYPSVAQCLGSAVERNGDLWSRRPEHPEFLQVRLGMGVVPARVTLKEPENRGIVELLQQEIQLRAAHMMLPDAPVVADLRSVGGLGIAGPASLVERVARGVVAQVACLHSPAEVTLACITSTARKPEWAWLEWLPHTASAHSPLPGVHLAATDTQGRALLDQLEELIIERGDGAAPTLRGPLDDRNEDAPTPVTPSVVVILHEPSVDKSRLARVAEAGPDVGVHVIWVGEELSDFPGSCRTYLNVGEVDGAVVGMVRSEWLVDRVATEALDVATAMSVGRGLAPVVDASAPVTDDSDLPRMVSVVGLLGQPGSVEPEQILTRWRDNGSLVDRSAPPEPRERAGDLRALVGHGGIEPFALDLRTQGPHALVGGTTGSGKSEFLQAWVLGMAHTFSPDRVTFLFIDYKGGAAFAKCVDLPHSVGIVTDLSPYLVRRSLRSLRAEIRRREHLFNDKGVKDLIDFEKTGDPDCPPSLIIIVDEFAALLGEVPEFIDGVIDVAQRGRSLGLHLILATQRPAGVIKDSLRANTNLRIALRMNDEHDSTDVLGSRAAADIDPGTPGRGVARVGPGRLIPFQSAFPGARTPAEPPAPPIDLMELDFGAGTQWKVPREKTSTKRVDKDINRVVDALADAAKIAAIPAPRKPWLETMPAGYDLKGLSQRNDSEIVLGVVDDPDRQSQEVTHFRPDESGNIVYFGTGGSGKTTALRSLATAASITPSGGPVHIYGLDFAGGGLRMLEALPNVGSIIDGDDEERVARLMRKLRAMVDERAARFNAVRADTLKAFREKPGNEREPRILLLLDGFGTFRTEYDAGLQRQQIYGQFQQIANEGRGVGIHIAITADRPMAVPNAILGAFQHRIVMRLADDDAYMALGVPKDVLGPSSPPGRCMNAVEPNELQLAVLGRDTSPPGQAQAIELLAASLGAKHQAERPAPIRRLADNIPVADLPPAVGGLPTLGVEDVSLAPVGFDPTGGLLIAGPGAGDAATAMAWLAHSMQRALPQVPRVLLSPRATPLAEFGWWNSRVSGIDQVKEYLESQLKPFVQQEAPKGSPGVAIFIDQVPEFGGSALEQPLVELTKLVRRNGHLLVAAGETAGIAGYSSLNNELKSGRAGFLLAPESTDGDMLKVQLGKVRAVDFPPGRGFWIAKGKATKVQLPIDI